MIDKDDYCEGLSDYCICGNNYENCTCIKCDVCMKYYPQTELYYQNNINICQACLKKADKHD